MITSRESKEADIPHRFSAYVRDNTLNLYYMELTATDVPEIIAFLKQHPNINTVHLSGNNLRAQGAADFSKDNETATNVDLSDNNIQDAGIAAIAKNNRVIKTINLSLNDIRSKGAGDFARYNKIITSVDLSDNNIITGIGDKGLAEFIKYNKTVTKLYMRLANISPDGISHFAKNNKIIDTVDFSQNYSRSWLDRLSNRESRSLGDEGIANFTKHNKIVTTLIYIDNDTTDKSFDTLLTEKKLTRFVDNNLNNLSPSAIEKLVKHFTINYSPQIEFMKAACLIASARANYQSKINLSFFPLIPEIMQFVVNDDEVKSKIVQMEGVTPLSFFERVIAKESIIPLSFFKRMTPREKPPTLPNKEEKSNLSAPLLIDDNKSDSHHQNKPSGCLHLLSMCLK